MGRRSPRSRDALLDRIAEVLAGRRILGSRELVELIREVNPSGRILPAAEVQARYRLKSQLQSLLIRQAAAELEVVRERDDGELVLLRLAGTGLGACHARVAELDEEARRWVRLQLDLDAAEAALSEARAEGPGAPGGRRGAGVAGAAAGDIAVLLATGQAAQEAYDYEAAREALEAAWRVSRGEARAARALLELLLHVLGDAEGALPWCEQLAAEALEDRELRALVALAAARGGQRERAARLVRGLEGETAAEALTALGQAALAEGALEVAETYLRQARLAASPSAELVRAEAALAAARVQARAPLEAQLEERLRAGALEAAQALAQELLAADPACGAARRALATIAAAQRQAQADRLVQRALAALAEERPEAAVALTEEALALGAELPAALWEARRALRAQRERLRLAQVEQLLAGADPGAGLRAWLGLEAELRQRVAVPAGRARAAALAAELAAGGRTARAEELAAAALALAAAEEALAGGELAAAERLVAAQARLCAPLPAFRALERELRAQAVARARDALARARSQLEASELAGARAALDALDLAALPADEVALARDLGHRLARQQRRQLLLARLDQCTAAGAFLAARAAARELLETGGDDAERAADAARAAAAEDQLRRHHGLHSCAAAEGVPIWLDLSGGESAAVWLDASGQALTVCEALDRYVFLHVLDPARGQVASHLALRTSHPLRTPTLVVGAHHLVLCGEGGQILELDPQQVQIVAHDDLAGVAEADEVIETTLTLPGQRTAWLITSKRPEFQVRARLLQRDTLRVLRPLPQEVDCVHAVALPGGPRILASGDLCETGLHLPHGANDDRLSCLDEGWNVLQVSGGLTDGALLVAAALEDAPDAGLEVRHLVPGEPPRTLLAASHRYGGDSLGALATAATTGTGYLLAYSDEIGEFELCALHLDGERSSAVAVPSALRLAVDENGQHVAAVWSERDGLRCRLLTTSDDLAALAAAGEVHPVRGLPDLHRPWLPCASGEPPDTAVLQMQLLALPADRWPAWIEEQRARRAGDPAGLYQLCALLQQQLGVERSAIDELIAWARERHPGDPALAHEYCKCLIAQGRWAEVPAAIAAIDETQRRLLPLARQQHLLHILTLAHLHGGDIAAACGTLDTACELGVAHCQQLSMLQILLGTDEPFEDLDAWLARQAADEADLLPVLEFFTRVRSCDAHWASGELDRARQAIDAPVVWLSHELQSLGRLAELTLLQEVPPGPAQLHKARALAAFLECHQPDSSHRETVIIGHQWPAERLARVADQARAWLEDYFQRAAT